MKSATKFGALLFAAALVIVGCGTPSVPAEDLQSGVADSLEAEFGQRPEVECDDDLLAEVGDEVRCTLTFDDGSSIGSTITASEVDGSTVLYDILVDG